MPTFVKARTGQVLGGVDGRSSDELQDWLQQRSPSWRDHVEITIDPSAPFRSAITRALPDARVTVDHLHLVKLSNQVVTWTLYNSIDTWWEEIETFIATGVANARTEAATTAIKRTDAREWCGRELDMKRLVGASSLVVRA
ncbi:transposase [Brachybacterium alimentarium]|uniref:transposase n=1 Tax=Brachybacterium alimentarium TaxID=47845 RepID=UPI003FCF8252